MNDVKMNEPSSSWLADAAQRAAVASMMEMARLAAGIYIGALAEGLSAAAAKDVVEATVAAMLRATRERQEEG